MGLGHLPLVAVALLVLSLRPAALTPPCLRHCPPDTFLSCEKRSGEICDSCPPNTVFRTAGAHGTCSRCRKCEGKFIYKRNCSPTVDAECECIKGYRCSGKDCSKCVENCGVGEEPTLEGCLTCPKGTFNNQTNGSCRQWTTCLPGKVLVNGTDTTDVVCRRDSEIMTPAVPSIITPIHVQGKDLQSVTVSIAFTAAIIACVMVLLPFCVCLRIWDKKKLPTIFKKMKVTPQQSTQEEDACSCRFPEEEQGDCDDCSKSKLFKDFVVN
uniref:TNF receptor superfamily member 9 n=1 Tax=Pelusios castaneus TaxID=367368 RepID=A0A8C8SHL2_9SAUR